MIANPCKPSLYASVDPPGRQGIHHFKYVYRSLGRFRWAGLFLFAVLITADLIAWSSLLTPRRRFKRVCATYADPDLHKFVTQSRISGNGCSASRTRFSSSATGTSCMVPMALVSLESRFIEVSLEADFGWTVCYVFTPSVVPATTAS